MMCNTLEFILRLKVKALVNSINWFMSPTVTVVHVAMQSAAEDLLWNYFINQHSGKLILHFTAALRSGHKYVFQSAQNSLLWQNRTAISSSHCVSKTRSGNYYKSSNFMRNPGDVIHVSLKYWHEVCWQLFNIYAMQSMRPSDMGAPYFPSSATMMVTSLVLSDISGQLLDAAGIFWIISPKVCSGLSGLTFFFPRTDSFIQRMFKNACVYHKHSLSSSDILTCTRAGIFPESHLTRLCHYVFSKHSEWPNLPRKHHWLWAMLI